MRDLRELDAFRKRGQDVADAMGFAGDETCGAFLIPFGGHDFLCIASANLDWDHVSVSLPNRCPSWNEMSFIKRRFFRDNEVAMQLHLPEDEHINNHPYCLHLWRPHTMLVPRPPASFV